MSAPGRGHQRVQKAPETCLACTYTHTFALNDLARYQVYEATSQQYLRRIIDIKDPIVWAPSRIMVGCTTEPIQRSGEAGVRSTGSRVMRERSSLRRAAERAANAVGNGCTFIPTVA